MCLCLFAEGREIEERPESARDSVLPLRPQGAQAVAHAHSSDPGKAKSRGSKVGRWRVPPGHGTLKEPEPLPSSLRAELTHGK